MYCIIPESDDPFFNLAVEEVLLKNSHDDFLLLGINRPSVIIGKHQNPYREVNSRFLYENSIPVIRRISGGGTVFHDDGNLNFTFILQSESGKQVDFHKYTLPVIDFLSSEGVNAIFEGKNDLKVNGLKISGNAEHVYRNRVLHHGTLLFSSRLDSLRSSLRKDGSHYSSRAVNSNPSPVTNLKEMLPAFRDIYEFRQKMLEYFLASIPGTEQAELTEDVFQDAHSLARSKYRTWEWNFAYSPDYQFKNMFLYNSHEISCMFSVKEGIITESHFEGPGFIMETGEKLKGCRHEIVCIKKILEDNGISSKDFDVFNLF